MIITSLYGMKFRPEQKQQKHYEKQRKEAIALLGKKYLLATPLTKKEKKNEIRTVAGVPIVEYTSRS